MAAAVEANHPEKVQHILDLADRMKSRTQKSIDATRIGVLKTIIVQLKELALKKGWGTTTYDLLSFLFTEELKETYEKYEATMPTDQADGKGGMFISRALWTIIGTIMDSDSFKYDKKGHTIFQKAGESGRDVYIKSVVMFTHKTEEQTADAVHLSAWGPQYEHQHRIRTVLGLFAKKRTHKRGARRGGAAKKLKSIKFEPIYQGQLVNFITGSRVGTLTPPYYKELENNEIFGIDFDKYQQKALQQIADKNSLHINEVKNILALVLLMEHELVHTMLEYDEGSLQDSRRPPGYDEKEWKKIKKIPSRADKHHGEWFDYFVRKLFGQVGIYAAIDEAPSPMEVCAEEEDDYLLPEIKKLRF